MGHWRTLVITARVPRPRVCVMCEKSAGGCKERSGCAAYATERLVRELLLKENHKAHSVEYDLREVAIKGGRLRRRQL